MVIKKGINFISVLFWGAASFPRVFSRGYEL